MLAGSATADAEDVTATHLSAGAEAAPAAALGTDLASEESVAIALDVGPAMVSTLALQVFWDYLDAANIDREPLTQRLEGRGVDVSALFGRGKWVSYGTFVAVEAALAEVVPRPDLYLDVGLSVGRSRSLGFLRTVSRRLLSPRFVYVNMPRMMKGALFRFVDLKIEPVSWNTLRGRYRFSPECPPTDAFLETARGVLSGVPLMVGAPPAQVTLRRVGAHGAEVEIVVEQWQGPWAYVRARFASLRRIFGLSRVVGREVEHELEATNRLLEQQVAELQALRGQLEVRVAERTAELEHARVRLEATVAELERSDRARTAFFTNVSHEFKTPLMLILSAADELNAALDAVGGTAGDAARGAAAADVQTVRRNALALLLLINEILDFSRLDAGRMPVRPSRFDLALALREAADGLAPLAQVRRQTLAVDAPSDGLHVDADRTLVLRAVVNLVVNALKYSHEGDAVTVAVERVDDLVRIRVRDTGPGIPADQQARIFERFHRSVDADGRVIDGSGIGLAMVAEIAELHGGKLDLASAQGQGATFTITLPVHSQASGDPAGATPPTGGAAATDVGIAHRAAADAQRAAGRHIDHDDVLQLAELEAEARLQPRERPAVAGAAIGAGGGGSVGAVTGAQMRHRMVLVVDDNDELRAWMRRVLERHYRVVTARDGREALAVVAERRPDLVVSDVMMPVMDGLELSRTLKSRPETAQIPVILVTARHGAQAVVAGFEALADDFVPKPFAADELLVRVGTQLRLRELVEQLVASEKSQLLASLSSGMAHEILNPLNALMQSVRLLREDVGGDGRDGLSDDERLALLGAIARGGERIEAIIRALQRFARHDGAGGGMQPVLLAERVDAMLPILRHRLGDIELTQDHAYRGPIFCHPDLLDQLVANLLLNAADAAGPGGQVILRCSAADGVVAIAVQDDGPGVAEADRERIFRPFETTKAPGVGTGLGLAICTEIAGLHHGKLRLLPAEPGHGATFVFELPLSPPQTPPEPT